MKPIPYLLKKIRQYDPKMLLMMAVNALLSAAYPFIWVLVPAAILRNYQVWNRQQLIMTVVLAGLGAMLAGFVVAWLKGNYRMRMNNVRYHLIRDLARVSLRMPYGNTLLPKTLDEINFAHSSVSNPLQGAGGVMLDLLPLSGQILSVLGFSSLLVSLSPWILILLVVILVSNYLIIDQEARYSESIWQAYMPLMRRYETLQEVISDPLRKKDVLLYNTWEMLREYLRKYADLRLLQDVKASKKHFQFMSALTLVDLIRDLLVYGWIIRQFALGLMDASVFTLYTAGLLSFMVVSQQLIKNVVDVQLESKRFQKFIDFTLPLEKQIQERETVRKQDPASDENVPEIIIENLTFIYPNTTTPVLEGLDLRIPAGEKLALVGENGAGKSTLIKLLCRLYKPSSGRILINGKDIWEYNEEDYHQLLSVVFQDAMLLPFTIRDNITMSTDLHPAAFELAVERSGLSEVINKLPAKEDTYLLRILNDEGVDLSGGERQKLFLARALYKTGSKMLVLDEPTAALDPLAEREMYERYAQFTQGKTSIFVSHRLASTRFCDRVAFLKDGRILELGTHDQLIAQKGEYAELFEIQAKNYRQSATTEKGVPEYV